MKFRRCKAKTNIIFFVNNNMSHVTRTVFGLETTSKLVVD